MITARAAANHDGWLEVFGLWYFTNIFAEDNHPRPLYWRGTARDLCLAEGIVFDERDPQTH